MIIYVYYGFNNVPHAWRCGVYRSRFLRPSIGERSPARRQFFWQEWEQTALLKTGFADEQVNKTHQLNTALLGPTPPPARTVGVCAAPKIGKGH